MQNLKGHKLLFVFVLTFVQFVRHLPSYLKNVTNVITLMDFVTAGRKSTKPEHQRGKFDVQVTVHRDKFL